MIANESWLRALTWRWRLFTLAERQLWTNAGQPTDTPAYQCYLSTNWRFLDHDGSLIEYPSFTQNVNASQSIPTILTPTPRTLSFAIGPDPYDYGYYQSLAIAPSPHPAWSPDDVVFVAHGDDILLPLIVGDVKPGTYAYAWRTHDGTGYRYAWSPTNVVTVPP